MPIKKVDIVRGSNIILDRMFCEAQVDGEEQNSKVFIAGIEFVDGKWQVGLFTSQGMEIDVSWEDFAMIYYRFSAFMAEESEIMILNKDNLSDEDK